MAQGKLLKKGTYAHLRLTDVLGITIDHSTVPVPRPSISSKSDNGFDEIDTSVMSFDNGTRTFTIGPASDAYYIWTHGENYKKTEEESVVLGDIEGLHYIHFDEGGVLKADHTSVVDIFDVIIQNAFVAVVYWNATDNEAIFIGEERHGRMDGSTHLYLHRIFGTQWFSGLALGNFSVDGNGSLAAHAQFSVANGFIRDEDLEHNIVDGSPQELSPIANLPIFYRSGVNGDWKVSTPTAFPVLNTGTGRVAWNQFTGGSWQLTEINNNYYTLIHVFATNNIEYPVIVVMGQSQYLQKNNAELAAESEISNLVFGSMANLTPEFTPLATVIVQSGNGMSNSVKAAIASIAGGGSYVDWRASEVSASGVSPAAISHNDTLNRDAADAHPISAITDLQDSLDDKLDVTGTAANSLLLQDLSGTAAATANTVVTRNGSNVSNFYLVRIEWPNEGSTPAQGVALCFRVNDSTDNYLRFMGINNVKEWLSTAHGSNTINKVQAAGYLNVTDASTRTLSNLFGFLGVTRVSTGLYRVTFSPNTVNNAYSLQVSPWQDHTRTWSISNQTVSSFDLAIRDYAGNLQDSGAAYLTVFHNNVTL